jgi:predicted transposase YbfD/YdcC
LIEPSSFQACFLSWVKSVTAQIEGDVISIDGKRLCNSGSGGKKTIVHMVSAWSSSNEMVLTQQKVDDKSNEITAIPEVLQMLYLKGCLVTIDAMGCQKTIAKAITDKEADYILAVKENQGRLLDDIKEAFQEETILEQHTQVNTGHGRIEKRTCTIITNTEWVCKEEDWHKLNTLIRLESERTIKANGKTEKQVRYYISSRKASAAVFNHAIREHWGIENKLHWTLDVAFNEDKSNKRAGNAAENFSYISKIALNLLKQHDDFRGAKRISMKLKRKKSSWSKEYLLTVLSGVKKF